MTTATKPKPARKTAKAAATPQAKAERTSKSAKATGRKATAEPARRPDPAITPRKGTKQAALIAMLDQPEGATIAEIVTATNWQPHTVRGAIAGALKRRLGLTIESEKVDDRGRVYRIRR